MKTRSATWVSQVVHGEVLGDADVLVGPDVVIDTHRATTGSLFLALPGERVDGHDFTSAAADAGASAVLVTRPTATTATQILVDDGVAALSALGSAVVQDAKSDGLQVLAITGSSGKTSTKDILAQVLEAHAPTVAPLGSFNNEIGVPLTACRVDATTRFLVSEMGARGPGHIRWLCSLVHPDISLVLNVGSAHLGEFGSVEGIARAKGEIIEPLAEDGWAVLNLDDEQVVAMASRTSARLAWFTVNPEASFADVAGESPERRLLVQARDLVADDLGRYRFTLAIHSRDAISEQDVQLALIGRHHVANAVAAAAAAIVAGVPTGVVAAALNELQHRSPWRMELRVRADGAAVINDAYNANPDSMRAALAALAEIGASRRRDRSSARVIAVLGDMLELGDAAARLHHQVGVSAAEAGVDEVWAIGEHAADIVAGAHARGLVGHKSTVEEASSLDLGPEDVVLVKASRGLALERVAIALLQQDAHPAPVQAEDNPLTNPAARATSAPAKKAGPC